MLRPLSLLMLAIYLQLTAGCDKPGYNLLVNDLKCENMIHPEGIATTFPRLSWKIISDANGIMQKAYQIIAASEEGLLNEDQADLWNSGKVRSDQSVLVPWNERKLNTGSPCFWKVRIWDGNGRLSEWSEASHFITGLLEESDWKAEYIGLTDSSGINISPLLRKNFTLDNIPGHLFLHVNSLGYHEVWVNGTRAGEAVLSPAVSQFTKRSLVNTYDITSLVREGKNDLVLWLGRGWYSEGLPGVVKGGPFVKAQLEAVVQGERRIICSTDLSWEARSSGYSTIGTWRPGKFGGELADGSVILPDLSTSSLDSATWEPVRIASIPEHNVTPQMTEPNRIFKSLKPVSASKIDEKTWLVDIGTTLTGWFEIWFPPLKPGQEVVLEYCDHLDKDGKSVNQGQTDRYLAAGSTEEHFVNKFNYHGFRYIKISGLSVKPDTGKMIAHLIHTGYMTTSSFESSDPDLNQIHDMLRYTLRCLSLGGYLVDCPQIERLGYGGDGNASTLTAQTMFDLAPLYVNWMQAWSDCIRDDGGMPHTAPNPYPAGGGPYWCGFIITSSWKSYQSYGDISFLERYYPVMQKWLGYAEKYSPAGLLEPWPETDYRSWYLGDWAVPEGIDQTDPASIGLVNNCFLSVCYETMNKIALVLGNSDDAMKYAAMTEVLKKKIRKKFFDPTQNIFGSGSQIDLTYPLLSGVVPDSLIQQIRQNLIDFIEAYRGGHFACGLVGVPVFTEWAIKNREADLMYSMLKKRDYPGYLYMIDNGATTTWEHWNGARSRIHNCYNGIGSWFYQAVGGIQPVETGPGYRKVTIDPQIPEGVIWANVSKETPYGSLEVNWKKEKEKLQIRVKIPAGCRAKVRIPDEAESYIMNGRKLTNKTGFAETGSGNQVISY